MAVRKDEAKNRWLAEFYKDGKRVRKWFLTKGEATRFYRLNAPKQGINNTVPVSSPLTLSHFVQQWFDLHGKTLADGTARLNKLLNLCDYLGGSRGSSFFQ